MTGGNFFCPKYFQKFCAFVVVVVSNARHKKTFSSSLPNTTVGPENTHRWGKHHSLYGWSPVLQVWIQLLCLWWMNNSFTCLVKTKPVKQEVNRTVILAQSREHSLLGEVSLHGWSPFLQVLAQLFHYIIITTYLIFWSNQILLNRRRAVQWSSPCCKCSTVCHDRK